MERSIQKLARLILIIALSLLAAMASGQDGAPPNAGPPVASDQLPARRSFPPLPINDLRSAVQSRQTESPPITPAAAPASLQTPGAAPSIPNLDADSGNTSGSFLRPITPIRDSKLDSTNLAPQSPPSLPVEMPLASPITKSNPPSALNPNGSSLGGSRPVELVADSTIVDSEVKPAAAYAPLGATLPGLPGEANRPRGLAPAELARQQLQRYSISQASEPLPGQPLKLEDLLRSIPPDRRRGIVRQYWNTYGAWASYLDCCDQCMRLDAIGPSSDPNQMKLLEATRMQADDNRLQAEIRLQQAQSELQRLLPSAGSDLLPLPADQPLVEVYETHADWYIANGQLPPNLRTVSRSLPLQQKLLCQRAATCDNATMNSQLAAQAHAAMQCDLLTLLGDLALSSNCRQAFLQSVLDYNQAIADYSLGIAPANQPPATLASMLVAPTAAAKADSRSVLAEVPARPSDRWAGTPSQPRSIRTSPGAAAESSPPRQATAPVADNPSSGFAPKPMNQTPPTAGTPNFGPPPATGFGPAMGNPAAPTSPLEPAATAAQPAPLTPASSPSGGFDAPASSPPSTQPSAPPSAPSGNPAGSFSPPPSGSPSFGPAPSASGEKSPTAPAPPASSGTQFKLGG